MENTLENYDNIEIIRDGDKVTRNYKLKVLLHRTDGPAVEYPEGEEWWINGKLHREGDLPAVDLPKLKKWYKNGVVHRDSGPAIESFGADTYRYSTDDPDGPDPNKGDEYQIWCVNGYIHRIGNPAYINKTTGYRSWRKNGKLHRTDGPATEYSNGQKGWYIDGKAYSESGFLVEINKLNKTAAADKFASLSEPTTNGTPKKFKVLLDGIECYTDHIQIL